MILCYGIGYYTFKFWDFKNDKFKNGMIMLENESKVSGIHLFSNEDFVIISCEKHIMLWKI